MGLFGRQPKNSSIDVLVLVQLKDCSTKAGELVIPPNLKVSVLPKKVGGILYGKSKEHDVRSGLSTPSI